MDADWPRWAQLAHAPGKRRFQEVAQQLRLRKAPHREARVVFFIKIPPQHRHPSGWVGFKILLKLPGLVVLVLLQERAAGEPNSNPVPWSIAAAALWVHPHPNGRLAFARGLGDTLCPGTSVSREA